LNETKIACYLIWSNGLIAFSMWASAWNNKAV